MRRGLVVDVYGTQAGGLSIWATVVVLNEGRTRDTKSDFHWVDVPLDSAAGVVVVNDAKDDCSTKVQCWYWVGWTGRTGIDVDDPDQSYSRLDGSSFEVGQGPGSRDSTNKHRSR